MRPPHVGPAPRGFLVLLAGFTALAPLSIDIYLPVLPQLADSLSASPAAASLTVTAVLLGMVVGQLIGGPLSDQRGRRGTLIVGLAGVVATNLLCAFAPSIVVLVAARFLAGIAVAFAMVSSRAMVADVYPQLEMARAYALLGAITGIAPVVAPVAGGVLALVTDWRGIFLVLAGIGILLFILAVIRAPETVPVHARQQRGVSHGARDLALCLRDRRFMTYVGGLAAAGGMLFTYISTSPFVLQDGFGLSPTAFAAVFALNSIGIFTTALIGRRTVLRVGSERLVWTGQWLALTGSTIAAASLLTGFLAGTLVGLFVAVSSMGLLFAQSTALGIAASPVRAGAASALLGIAGFLVGGLLAPLGGLGSDGIALGILMVAFSVGGVLVHRLLPPTGPVPASDAAIS